VCLSMFPGVFFATPFGITATPEVTLHTITPEDAFVVLATSGVSGVAEPP
jgi:hypothetical protein